MPSSASRHVIRTIDAHAGGGAVRLIVDGFLAPRGRTMLEKRAWLAKHADHWRRAVLLEPRGHGDLCGAVLTEPVAPGSHAGLLFLDNEGYAVMSGHALLAVTTIVLERGLITTGGDPSMLTFDTPAGTVRARATFEAGRIARVSFVNVPSFVLHAGLPIAIGPRKLRADVAFGGVFYAIVDSEAIGLPVDSARLPELRRAGMEIRRAIQALRPVVHPLETGVQGVAGTIFTAPPRDERSALRSVVIFADAAADRSPGGTATAALMAVLDAMGLIEADTPFVHEGLIGTRFTGRLVGRTNVGESPAILAEIEGVSRITGEHTFFIDDDDPLKSGFRV